MNNILIPTDFTSGSLDNIVSATEQLRGKCNIFLFHAFDMPASLVDAISKSGISSHNNLITEELRVKCKKLKYEHSKISNIYFRIMHGTTIYAFKNFAEANEIDAIFLAEGYSFRPVVRESVDPTGWFKKSGIRIISPAVEKIMQPIPESADVAMQYQH